LLYAVIFLTQYNPQKASGRHHSAHVSKAHTAKHLSKTRHQSTASWYGADFHGKKTANGERFNMYAMTAAHKTLPLSSYAEVTNLKIIVAL